MVILTSVAERILKSGELTAGPQSKNPEFAPLLGRLMMGIRAGKSVILYMFTPGMRHSSRLLE